MSATDNYRRDSYNTCIGFRVQFNAEFPRQVMDFPIISDFRIISGARRAETNFLGDRVPPLSQGLDDRPPPLSEGLDPQADNIVLR